MGKTTTAIKSVKSEYKVILGANRSEHQIKYLKQKPEVEGE